jgi:hypothetical protein
MMDKAPSGPSVTDIYVEALSSRGEVPSGVWLELKVA